MATAVETQGASSRKAKKNALSDGQGTLAWILVAPTLAVILFVVGIPIVLSVIESFYKTSNGIDPTTGMAETGTKFVGLENYLNALTSNSTAVDGVFGSMPRLMNAFVNNVWFTVICVVIETILGVAMALIMARAFKGTGLVRAAILVPWAIPTIVSAKLWFVIFQADGVANKILGKEILWLGDSSASQLAVIMADVWKTAPFIGLLTLAGLQTIPAEVYEAAKVDGATAWQQFTRITLPMVKPALVVAVLFRTLDTMRMFDLPYGLIGPNKYSVETLSMFAYNEAVSQRYGPAAAYSILLFLLICLVAFLFIKLLGADVVGDDETRAKTAQRKRMRALHKQQVKRTKANQTITSGESAA
ncbi:MULTISPECIES: carbohydrate ABC transporter permease [Luteococcus]|uniref:Maltose/maltodextrin ABC transporter, permease protein MalF n=1 Tax=Luteococcus japonicus LSP_Lj1 TaxID=1255658 RepID=A0A1R4KPI8_9ACTN|nr:MULTISPECIES: sugar ABC transporter permease [Luteococcus]MDN5563777.1 sugar ABC transporter permease [Luteococcus sp.]SJN45934.1 Maltose/maltodextrin ABC transporter, permease protein MalF [Luteococcus japonicus LSP_Lj1]